ncbi:MAG TPA: hypothetical protein VGL59_13545 [Polyangia bacterium]|jgi:hypothetical protein
MTPHIPTRPDISDDDVRRMLGGLRVDPADGGFREALHRRLAAEAPPQARGILSAARALFARWPAVLWPATGVLSGAAAFAVLVALRAPAIVTPAPAAAPVAALAEVVHRVPADKTAVIRINFAAEVAVNDVNFEITLPDGLSFWSRGEKLAMRSFRWQGKLDAGDNPIPIAVRGDRPGVYRVRADADAGGTRIEHEVVLQVEGA